VKARRAAPTTGAFLVYTGADGKVIGDTRRNRIEAIKKLAELSSRYAPTDLTVRRILDSFDAAVRYPGSALVYLYEVWEALRTRFRGERKTRKILGIRRKKRSRLTRLADKEPLNQGRHRGKFAGKLRDAAAIELDEAWAIARDMYERYLNFLDKSNSPQAIIIRFPGSTTPGWRSFSAARFFGFWSTGSC
jgi:hypothetical protein